MKRRRLLAFLLTLTMVLTYMPALAFADGETASEEGTIATEGLQTEDFAAEPETVDETAADALPDTANPEQVLTQEKEEAVNGMAEEPVYVPKDQAETELTEVTGTASGSMNVRTNVNLPDNDELLLEYLEQGMPLNAQAASSTRGSKLEGNSKTIYYMLKNAVIALTDDDEAETYTQYGITAKQLTFDKTSFTKEDLGVSKLVEDGTITPEAVKALFAKMGVNQTAILYAMLSDMPYYLYWFDKTKKTGGMDLDIESVSTESDSEGEVVKLIIDNSELTFSFTVAGEYQDNGNKYKVNLDKIRAANAAKRNAANIISENQDRSDYMKLASYRDSICDLTSYHDDAGHNLVDYGDPWQMVYVFDGDKDTKVVCEGYSKAFQFLCDNSSFDNDIECDSVTGTMAGGGEHMWNVLHMEDNKNYIVDVTNCDEGTVGAADEKGGPYLFMNGCKPGGSVDAGYHYSCQEDTDMFYTYDADTKGQFAASELAMSETSYEYPEDQKKIDELVSNAATALRTSIDKAEAAKNAVAKYQAAADDAKKAADKAASTLSAKDIADAQAKAKAAEDLKAKANASLEEADKAQAATTSAIETAAEAINAASSEVDKRYSNEKLSAVKTAAETVSGEVSTAKANKAASDTKTADAEKTIDTAVTKKAEADKAAAEKAAAAKAAAEKAEADRKAAEFAANGNAYVDPTLPKVKIQKPKAAKKSFTAKWKKIKNKKQLKKIKGIEVEYSLTSDFQNPLFKSASKKKANVKIKKLLSKKTYYVRAHTYVIRNGVKYVSNWSATKKVKVK